MKIWTIPIYMASVFTLMIVNIGIFNPGDPKFDGDIEIAITLYAPLWGALYFPHIFVGWLVLSGNAEERKAGIYYFLLLITVLFMVQISFVFDAGWSLILFELFAILGFTYLLRRLSFKILK